MADDKNKDIENKAESPELEVSEENTVPEEAASVAEMEFPLDESTAEESIAEPTDELAAETTEEVTMEFPEVEQTAGSNESTVSLDLNIDNQEAEDDEKPVTVQAVKFASFEDDPKTKAEQNKNLDILMDIKLQLTVELGRAELPVKKVLELTRGSIVELEKVAGEPVELYANGKLVAQGEVVVIEDNFGLRITGITDPEDRLKGL